MAQCRPWSDCSFRNILSAATLFVQPVCPYNEEFRFNNLSNHEGHLYQAVCSNIIAPDSQGSADYFSYFSMKTCCRYHLEKPCPGTSKEYLQHVPLCRNKTNISSFNPYPAVHDNPYLCKQCRSKSGPSCSKLTTSLVNDSLKFTWSDTQICWNFLLKKCE